MKDRLHARALHGRFVHRVRNPQYRLSFPLSATGADTFCSHGADESGTYRDVGSYSTPAGVRFWSWGCRLKTSILKSARNYG